MSSAGGHEAIDLPPGGISTDDNDWNIARY